MADMQDAADKVFGGDPQTTTVAQAKDWLRQRASKRGAYCPCCKQYVKIYRRALGSQMARWLIWLVRSWEQVNHQLHGDTPQFRFDRMFNSTGGVWIDIRQSPVRGGDYAKLIHWGLIEQKPNEEPKKNGAKDTRDSGMWRPTFKGVDFVHRRCMVPSHVYLYDNMKLKEEETLINITDALGKKFSYQELMTSPISIEVPV